MIEGSKKKEERKKLAEKDEDERKLLLGGVGGVCIDFALRQLQIFHWKLVDETKLALK